MNPLFCSVYVDLFDSNFMRTIRISIIVYWVSQIQSVYGGTEFLFLVPPTVLKRKQKSAQQLVGGENRYRFT